MLKFLFALTLVVTSTAHASWLLGNAPSGVVSNPGRAQRALTNENGPRDQQTHGYFAFDLVAHHYNYQILRSSWGRQVYAPVHFTPLPPFIANAKTQKFLETLEMEKAQLMHYFDLSNQDYNRFFAMAIGILGNESRFFSSPRYFIKEHLPDFAINVMRQAITAARTGRIQDNPLRSRGGVQMKQMPEAVRVLTDQWATNEDLRRPEVAAVAVIAFLVNTREQVLQMARNARYTGINANNVFDYMPYIYMGSANKLRALFNLPAGMTPNSLTRRQRNNIATPHENTYIRSMRNHISRFVVSEATRFTLLGSAHDMAVLNPAILP